MASTVPDITSRPGLSRIADVSRRQMSPQDATPIAGAGTDRILKRRRWPPRRIVAAAATALFAALSVYGLLRDSGVRRLNVERDKLTISTVEQGPFLEYTPVRGTVLPIRTVYLDALESGTVERIYVEEGAAVAEGDSLLRLANPELELVVLQQESELERRIEDLRAGRLTMEQSLLRSRQQVMEIEYQLQILKRNYEPYATLSGKDLAAIMPLQEFEKRRDDFGYGARRLELTRQTHAQDSVLAANQVAQLGAAVERMTRDLAIIGSRLDNLTVRAPVSGQLTALDAEIGESKGAGARLGQVDILDGYKVRAAIDEHYIARVERDQRGEVDVDEAAYGLVVHKVYPEVRDGRFEVDLVFAGAAPPGIRRGQTVHVRLELGDLAEAVQVARGGFYQTTGGHWAYVLDPSGERAARREIQLGRQNPRVYEVLGGLAPGERVITSSYEGFGEDMDVLVLK